jgi:integrase
LRRDSPLEAAIESFFVGNYDIAAKTKEFYQTSLTKYVNFLREHFGREPVVADIDKDYVNVFLEDLSKKPTPKYPKGSPFRAKAAASTLKRFANWLAQEGILADTVGQSLLRHVKKPKVMENVRQPLSDEEIDAILSAYKPATLAYTVAALMIGTGIRFNEARELRVSDADFANGLLTVRGETSKTRNTRTVDVHDAVLKELDRYLRQRPIRKPEDPLLVTDEGRAYTKAGFNKVFRRIAKASGVRRFHAHLTRHTWATRFEGDILELKRQGGWSDWKQVERYRHAQRPNRESLVNRSTSRRR